MILPRRVKVAAIVLAAVLALAGATALAATVVFFRSVRVEGQSMAPTFRDQDRLIVHKWAYHSREPQRADLVMIAYPQDPARKFLTRIVAMEGETVAIDRGRVLINGQPLDEPYISDQYRSADTWGPQTVPPGHYFVLGDHRSNSSDSRHWGWVPRNYLLGKVVSRWLSFD